MGLIYRSEKSTSPPLRSTRAMRIAGRSAAAGGCGAAVEAAGRLNMLTRLTLPNQVCFATGDSYPSILRWNR